MARGLAHCWPSPEISRAPGLQRSLFTLGAGVAALLLGYVVARDAWPLQFEVAFSLQTLGFVAVALVLSVLVVRDPGVGLFALLGFVYLNLSQVLVRYHDLPSLLQLLTFPLVLTIWVAKPRTAWRGHWALTWMLAAYCLTVLLSTILASDSALADARVVECLKMFAIYLVVVTLTSSRAVLRRSVWTLVISGAFLAGIALLQVATGDFANEYGGLARVKNAHIYENVFEPRIAGPLGDPNFFAQILLVLVPLALFLGWHAGHRLTKVCAFASAGLITMATVFTYSRGGALALGVVLLLSFLGRKIWSRHAAAAVVVASVLFLMLPVDFASRLTTIRQLLPGSDDLLHPDSSFEERKLLTTAAWRMLLDHPVLGIGAGNYTIHFDRYAEEIGSASRQYEEPGDSHYPHNLYLEIGAETGLLGIFLFGAVVMICLVSLQQARAAFVRLGDTPSAGLAQALSIAVTGYLISSLFLHGHFQRPLWLLFALAAASYGLSQRRDEAPAAALRSPGTVTTTQPPLET